MSVEDAHPFQQIGHGGVIGDLATLTFLHLGGQYAVDKGAHFRPEGLKFGIEAQFHRIGSGYLYGDWNVHGLHRQGVQAAWAAASSMRWCDSVI